MGFYKIQNDELLSAPESVHAPDYTLIAETKDEHVYPVDGWHWFDSLTEAMSALLKAPVDGVPQSVSFRQAKQELIVRGWWPVILAAVDTIADPIERELMRAEVLDSQEYERKRPALVAMAKGVLGLTDEQIDDLFIEAAKR
jgi:hypothetical protein